MHLFEKEVKNDLAKHYFLSQNLPFGLPLSQKHFSKVSILLTINIHREP